MRLVTFIELSAILKPCDLSITPDPCVVKVQLSVTLSLPSVHTDTVHCMEEQYIAGCCWRLTAKPGTQNYWKSLSCCSISSFAMYSFCLISPWSIMLIPEVLLRNPELNWFLYALLHRSSSGWVLLPSLAQLHSWWWAKAACSSPAVSCLRAAHGCKWDSRTDAVSLQFLTDHEASLTVVQSTLWDCPINLLHLILPFRISSYADNNRSRLTIVSATKVQRE